MAKLVGIPASPGVAIGRVYPVDRRRARVPRFHISPEQTDAEVVRLDQAVKESVQQLQAIRTSLGEGEQGDILDAHRMMADDPTLLSAAHVLIRDELLNAEWAMRRAVRELLHRRAHRLGQPLDLGVHLVGLDVIARNARAAPVDRVHPPDRDAGRRGDANQLRQARRCVSQAGELELQPPEVLVHT